MRRLDPEAYEAASTAPAARARRLARRRARSPAEASVADSSLFDASRRCRWQPSPPSDGAASAGRMRRRCRPGAASPAPVPCDLRLPHRAPAAKSCLDGHRGGLRVPPRAPRAASASWSAPRASAVSAPRWVGLARGRRGAAGEGALDPAQAARTARARARAWPRRASTGATAPRIPFLGETVIVVLDPRATGAVLHTAADALPGVPRLTLHLGLPHDCRARADPRRRAELAAAPGPAHLRGALRATSRRGWACA